jgi:holo-ACP synthase CitX
MTCDDAGMTGDPRADFLEARDARQAQLQRALAEARGRSLPTVLALGTNLPGPHKLRPGLCRLVQAGLRGLRETLDLRPFEEGSDLLGPFLLAFVSTFPDAAKRAAVAAETHIQGGRLLDVDIYATDGSQVDRRALGLPPRACYLCAEPAPTSIRLNRHTATDLSERVDALLRPLQPPMPRILPERLASHLVRGARRELELTPKPGLVDRHDSGSHPDLSFAAMRTSIDLLPEFYDDVLRCAQLRNPLEAAVRAGREAEARMARAVRANAHKGYIFLSGLVLLAVCGSDGTLPAIRREISGLAARFFERFEAGDTHGAEIRARLALGGIRAEAEAGLPSVFEVGWPQYREALDLGWDAETAGLYLMATLMQRVEDTTTLRRGGPEGLARLRLDGARLQRLLERRRDPRPLLADLNDTYCREGLTMGGVADCMALVFALQGSAGPHGGSQSPSPQPSWAASIGS